MTCDMLVLVWPWPSVLLLALNPYLIPDQANLNGGGAGEQISTLRAWSTYVYAAMDATGTGQHPIPNNQPAVALYFIVWVVVTAFFIVQMIIGVLIDSINMQVTSGNPRP